MLNYFYKDTTPPPSEIVNIDNAREFLYGRTDMRYIRQTLESLKIGETTSKSTGVFEYRPDLYLELKDLSNKMNGIPDRSFGYYQTRELILHDQIHWEGLTYRKAVRELFSSMEKNFRASPL